MYQKQPSITREETKIAFFSYLFFLFFSFFFGFLLGFGRIMSVFKFV
jgi:hypothetical protein